MPVKEWWVKWIMDLIIRKNKNKIQENTSLLTRSIYLRLSFKYQLFICQHTMW